MEGAIFLSQRLRDEGGEPERALREWEQERIPRTKRIVQRSRTAGSTEQVESPVKCFMRNRLIGVVTNGFFYSRAHKDLQVDYSA
jgi:2-polyprenyl-6-methoxyphenol hydroxylase-like FAD-dependent oxidoreductase